MTAVAEEVWTLWGKSDPHVPLIVHLLDVGACVLEILDREPPSVRAALARDWQLPEDQAVRLTAFLAAMHDFGKATPAFQTLWAAGWQATRARLGGPLAIVEPVGHGRIAYEDELLPETIEALLGPDFLTAKRIAHALACHHGRPFPDDQIPQRSDQIGSDTTWAHARERLVRSLQAAFGVDDFVLEDLTEWQGDAWMRLAGLVSFADWIGSSFWQAPPATRASEMRLTRWKQAATALYERARYDPADYLHTVARRRARKKLNTIGWRHRQAFYPQVPDFTALFPNLKEPRALQLALMRGTQAVLADAPPPGTQGTWSSTDTVLAIVEAPMGEGKTEAALQAALQLQTAFHHRGLYVALPTQATGDGMYSRVHEFLTHISGDTGRPADLHLLHGGRLLNDAYQHALRVTPNIPREHKAGVTAERWFEDRKRGLLAEHGVGTLDQALMGVLPIKHQFVRLWGLGGRVLIIDEVHAYDAYTTTILITLLRWLRAMGSSVILMSATLPRHTRQALLNAWQGPEHDERPLPPQPYPRVTLVRGSAVLTEDAAQQAPLLPGGSPPASRAAMTLNLQSAPASEHRLAALAARLVHTGGCAVIIVNTVARAQRLSRHIKRALKSQGHPVRRAGTPLNPDDAALLTLHARLPAAERQARDTLVRNLLGPTPAGQPSRRPHRMIVVATQVVEQSLDIDADVMISDLAPIDLLLQRAGRLHRHSTNNGHRANHDIPTLYVTGLNHWPERNMRDHAWQWVYARSHLFRTWTALQGKSTIHLPVDIESLVEQVHGPDDLSSLLDATQAATLQEAETEFEETIRKHQRMGLTSTIGLHESYKPTPTRRDPLLSEKDRETLGTRLGEPTVRLIPLHQINHQTLSLQPDRQANPGLTHLHGPAHAKAVYGQHIRVQRSELVNELLPQLQEGSPLAPAWHTDPLLRDCVPVVFEHRRCIIRGLALELDDELGLIYHDPRNPMPDDAD